MDFLIFIGIIAFIGVVFALKYNTIVALRNARGNSMADIDVQLKQRFDLVPTLVEIVKGYAKHESSVLEGVTAARSAWMGAEDGNAKLDADNMLTGALKSVFAISENYPDLKANTNFIQLQTELGDIENKIAAARRFLNSSTNEYNTYIQSFPNNFIASMFSFAPEKSYEVEDKNAIEQVPDVKF